MESIADNVAQPALNVALGKNGELAMTGEATVANKPFEGVRTEISTARSFDDVLGRLRKAMGSTSVPEIVALAKKPISQAEYIQKVEERFVGESGFMLFNEIDHGGWLPQFGINRRTIRWILGNPLIAITMIRHDITAGLFAPVEILVTEDEGGKGTTVTYVRPSSLMVIAENPPLRRAADDLDVKLDALINKATGLEKGPR
jgi:uncharacterized protein (DUF302 family)